MSAPHRHYATVSSLAFALVAIAQAWRAFAGLPVQIGTIQVPVAASAVVAVACAALAIWGWRSR